MPTSPIVQLLLLFGVAGVSFAAWKGGRAERIAAAVVATNLVVGLLIQAFTPGLQGTLRFANDGLAALILLGAQGGAIPIMIFTSTRELNRKFARD